MQRPAFTRLPCTRYRLLCVLLALAAAVMGVTQIPARADSDDGPRPTTTQPQLRSAEENHRRAIGADEVDGPTILEGLPALNPIDALRDDLRDDHGIYVHGVYLGDPYADLSGGLKRGATYSGRLDVELDVDLGKLAGLSGTAVHGNLFQIHGRDLSANDIGNLLSSNDIAALPTTRLYELYVEQRFGDMISLRAGQQGIDVEFLTSDYAANFIDATFGWAGLPTLDLPDGGPAYPLATPAIRLKIDPMPNLSILAAVFDGVPAGPCPGDPQACDRYGLNFRVSDPPLVFLESQYRYNRGPDAHGLPGTVKLGAFGYFGPSPDPSLASQGLTSNNLPLAARTPDGGAYAVLDQQVYRLSPSDPEKGIGVFARVIGAPSDRNLVDIYVDAGVSALGLVPGRPDDFFGVAGAFARISPAVSAADRAANVASGIAAPVRNFEAVAELTYNAVVIPGLAVQPTFQYIVHPGGHVADPYGNGLAAIPDAKVFGVTTTVRF